MFRELKTERLILKCIGYDDAEFFYKQFSDDEINRYLYDAEPCTSEDEAKEWIDFYLQDEPRDQHRWILVLKDSGEKIGTCGFHCWNRGSGEVEIGYDLQPAHWKCGYMNEALKEIIRYAEEEMQVGKIFAHIFVGNSNSIKSAERLGFVKTDENYCEEFHGEKYLHDIYALTLKESKGKAI